MANKYDLTPVIGQYLDRHLVFPLYQFLDHQQLYDTKDLLDAKLKLLEKTNMVDSFIDLYKLKNNITDDSAVPESYTKRREEVLSKLQELESSTHHIIEILGDEEVLKQLTKDKSYNLQYLIDNCDFKPDLLDTYYEFIKFQYDCGDYYGTAIHLAHFRIVSTDFNKCLSALWGKFAAEILNQNWEAAHNDMIGLAEVIDLKANEMSALELLQQRTWLIHWSLFVFFNHEKGRDGIIDMFFQPQYMNTIQTSCPHILRYLTAAVVTNKRRRNALKELVRVIKQESYTYSDPITDFLLCLYVNFDFDMAQEKLRECSDVLSNDFFLVACLDEFIENARLFIFENYCKVHPRISIKMLGQKLNLSEDRAEVWIVNLIRNARLDAKIDSQEGVVIMGAQVPSIYHQIIEKTSKLSSRTMELANQLGPNKRDIVHSK